MSDFSIGKHIGDIATLGAGGAFGAAVGNGMYSVTKDRLATYTIENGKEVPHITNRFIHYAQRVSELDVMQHIDPHTDRRWVKRTLYTIKNRAKRAKSNVMGDEHWEFQKIYNLGKKYLNQRSEVPKLDLGLAKRGANAIVYGTKVERARSSFVGGVIGATIAILAKYGIKKYTEYQENLALKNAPDSEITKI